MHRIEYHRRLTLTYRRTVFRSVDPAIFAIVPSNSAECRLAKRRRFELDFPAYYD